MDRCSKGEPTAKNLVCKKALPIPEKNWKNLLGRASTPLGDRRVKMKTQSIQLKVPFPVLFLAYRITRNETLRKQNTFCLVVFTPFLPSETGAGEPQYN